MTPTNDRQRKSNNVCICNLKCKHLNYADTYNTACSANVAFPILFDKNQLDLTETNTHLHCSIYYVISPFKTGTHNSI